MEIIVIILYSRYKMNKLSHRLFLCKYPEVKEQMFIYYVITRFTKTKTKVQANPGLQSDLSSLYANFQQLQIENLCQ